MCVCQVVEVCWKQQLGTIQRDRISVNICSSLCCYLLITSLLLPLWWFNLNVCGTPQIEQNMLAPNPTFDHNPQDLSSTVWNEHDLHPPNTLLSGDASKDCSLLLSNNPDIRLKHPQVHKFNRDLLGESNLHKGSKSPPPLNFSWLLARLKRRVQFASATVKRRVCRENVSNCECMMAFDVLLRIAIIRHHHSLSHLLSILFWSPPSCFLSGHSVVQFETLDKYVFLDFLGFSFFDMRQMHFPLY